MERFAGTFRSYPDQNVHEEFFRPIEHKPLRPHLAGDRRHTYFTEPRRGLHARASGEQSDGTARRRNPSPQPSPPISPSARSPTKFRCLPEPPPLNHQQPSHRTSGHHPLPPPMIPTHHLLGPLHGGVRASAVPKPTAAYLFLDLRRYGSSTCRNRPPRRSPSRACARHLPDRYSTPGLSTQSPPSTTPHKLRRESKRFLPSDPERSHLDRSHGAVRAALDLPPDPRELRAHDHATGGRRYLHDASTSSPPKRPTRRSLSNIHSDPVLPRPTSPQAPPVPRSPRATASPCRHRSTIYASSTSA